ncbi:protein kinase-like domain-containing protein [Artemisia annua]|uniref:Protein kinase-like domain-containing protein n=1 Tax=Artemisia annua TaxID=35608 RepID=A0A2U1K9P3_ARTAN|nr:protein kinase-like domain-containing protein [Artemisia annua]
MNAKLSDFGFARQGPQDGRTHVSTATVVGTKGYATSEYVQTGRLTTKIDVWNDDVGKLKVKVESKCKSFSDLIECLNAMKVEKNGLSAKLETLQKEDYSKDDLIQELETRLNSLQAVHVGVRLLVDDVDKVNNELTLKMAELNEKAKGSAKLFQKEEK